VIAKRASLDAEGTKTTTRLFVAGVYKIMAKKFGKLMA
jgi:hypothetical protein